MTIKYHVELPQVREVSLIGGADLSYWTDYLRPHGLIPACVDGQARILMVAASARFMRMAFGEVSFSVFVTHEPGGASPDGAYLLRAFNSRPFFAWVERTFFKTPYFPAKLRIEASPPGVGVEIADRSNVLFQTNLTAPRIPDDERTDGWEGPVFLPPKSPRVKKRRLFHARLTGHTYRYAYLPDADHWRMEPESEPFSLLAASKFQPFEWQIRPDATHGKSKTVTYSRDTDPLSAGVPGHPG